MKEQVPRRQRGIVKEQVFMKATIDRKLWRAMISQILKGYDTERKERKRRIKENKAASITKSKKKKQEV